MTTQVCENPSPVQTAVRCADAIVLVVDDDASFRALARAILEPGGFEVLEADSVAAGLLQLQSCVMDAVVLDIVMPTRDGIEALRDFKTSYPETKVLTISGANNCDLFLTISAHLGADGSLNKSKVHSLPALLNFVLDR